MTRTEKPYIDHKIELIVETLGTPVPSEDFSEIVEDLRLAYDGARRRRATGDGGVETFRMRCKSLIIAASRAKAMAYGREREFCEALEGVILHVILHDEES